MRILMVGAGAVGQVYGYHLARGGAKVSVYVREKYAAEAQRGYRLFQIHSRKNRPEVIFQPAEVVTSESQVAARTYDQVWVSVSMTALTSGALDGLFRSLQGEPTIVSLQPGLEIDAYYARFIPLDRLVRGTISMMSYETPLHTSDADYEKAMPPGNAFFEPPMGSHQFSGSPQRAQAVVDALRMGGGGATVVEDVRVSQGIGSAMLMPAVGTLELADWSFEGLRGQADLVKLAADSGKEAIGIVSRDLGKPVPAMSFVLSPFLLRMVLAFAPKFAPLDLEAFQHHHFDKVGDQTRAMLRDYIVTAQKYDLPHRALADLATRLEELHPRVTRPMAAAHAS